MRCSGRLAAGLQKIIRQHSLPRASLPAGASEGSWAQQSAAAQAAAALTAIHQGLGGAAAELLVAQLAAAAIGVTEDAAPPHSELTTQQASPL